MAATLTEIIETLRKRWPAFEFSTVKLTGRGYLFVARRIGDDLACANSDDPAELDRILRKYT